MLQFLLVLLFAIPAALLVAGAAGYAVAKRALLPVERMAERAASITANNLHDRLHLGNAADELGRLAGAFNRLLDRLEQSFEQLRRFTADAAHELRTPVAALRTIGEVALQDNQDELACRYALSSILEETSRLAGSIDSLLLLAHAEAAQSRWHPQTWPLNLVVNEVLGLLEVLSDEKHLTVLQEGASAGSTRIRADRDLLRTAIINVLHNAIKFSPEGGAICLAYERSGGEVSLLVQDEGPGIASGEHERVFERFYTSRARETAHASGTGLGLAISRLIFERLGGSIRFEDCTVPGARCVIRLPASADQAL